MNNELSPQACWIWYPGDFEIWLGNIFNNRRTERGAMFPPFWKQDSHWPTVEFCKDVTLDEEEPVTVFAEGRYNLSIDGKLQTPSASHRYVIPAGQHHLSLKVWNQATPPSIYIRGTRARTDASWLTTYEDKIWIDENGVAHGSGIYVPVGSWNFDSPTAPPSSYRLALEEQRPVSCEDGLYDFGRETFGYLRLKDLQGTVSVYYGESREEALDHEHCETLDLLSPGSEVGSKAFRYVHIVPSEGASFSDVTMDYEYAPFDPSQSGTFRCSDDELCRIWDVAARTLDLTTREFFVDGIKRDRWVWSGDAIQSYLMNYYLRFDTECVKRTIRYLRGKDPVTTHVNTIMDYTFYWMKSISDYLLYTGDTAFVHEMYPRMKTLMDFVLSRTDERGMVAAQDGDWIFVDWADFPMSKRGVLCFEQLLFTQALLSLVVCADVIEKGQSKGRLGKETLYYAKKMAEQLQLTSKLFWDDEKHAFIHAINGEERDLLVTKFPNMFYYLMFPKNDKKAQEILTHVLLSPDVAPITTPYMRFYELEALCQAGLHERVVHEVKDYWGGMLRLGATSFWEKYVPGEQGAAHLAMYGRPYGKSLCHAWGASPVYLMGRYFLGVCPKSHGYKEYKVEPHLGGLEWIEGDVPTPHGLIHVRMDGERTTVTTPPGIGKGVLRVYDRETELPAGETTVVESTKN